MRTFNPIWDAGAKHSQDRGSMMLEVLIAIVVLGVGMGGLIPLLVSSMYMNNKSGSDTSATMVAEHVLEQISAQPADSNAPLTVTDCAGSNWDIQTLGATKGAGNGGANGGQGAQLTSGGGIDWLQDYSSIPSGYAMQYAACGTGGRQTIYDIRWDVVTMTSYTRMIVVSARPAWSQTVGGLRYSVPVSLRTIGGM
jgi:type II secretory pathway pseudopilin PulG